MLDSAIVDNFRILSSIRSDSFELAFSFSMRQWVMLILLKQSQY